MDQSVFQSTLTLITFCVCMLKRAVVFTPFGACGFQFHKIELATFQLFHAIEQSHDLLKSHATEHTLESSYVSVVLMSGIWNVTHQDKNRTHQPNNCKCSVPWCMVLCEILLLSVF